VYHFCFDLHREPLCLMRKKVIVTVIMQEIPLSWVLQALCWLHLTNLQLPQHDSNHLLLLLARAG